MYSFASGDCGFNAGKIREMQNLDWAEDSVFQGLQYEKGFFDEELKAQVEPDSTRALEFYSNAIELDPLNKQALQLKGLLLKSLSRFAEAEECLKQAFKLDSEDLELEAILQDVMLANR